MTPGPLGGFILVAAGLTLLVVSVRRLANFNAHQRELERRPVSPQRMARLWIIDQGAE